jgi:uncharacterized protein (DUF302 family)
VTNGLKTCGLDLMARFDHAAAGINGRTPDNTLSQETMSRLPLKIWVTENDVLVRAASTSTSSFITSSLRCASVTAVVVEITLSLRRP